ncbi:MAG: NUDIX hydrolase [Bacteroidales bacterium]|nr:NUDIX hydrolase [Bacteroidales bacterium]
MAEQNTYSYQYPHPAVTTDGVIFGFDGKGLRVLWIERGQDPCQGKLAFPGGFLNMDETLEECARRELQEETSLVAEKLEQFHAFSAVDRDPRERVISVAFFGLVKMAAVHGGDDAQSAQWVRIDEVPQLAFDHDYIFREAMRYLRKKIFFEPIGFDLLDETFTFPQLQRLYEAILGIQFDRRNFKRKMLQLGLIENAEEKRTINPMIEDLDSNSSKMVMKDIDCLFLSASNLCPPLARSANFAQQQKKEFSHEVGRKPQWFKFNKRRYDELKENPGSFRLEF